MRTSYFTDAISSTERANRFELSGRQLPEIKNRIQSEYNGGFYDGLLFAMCCFMAGMVVALMFGY